jgi:hypothetical protein
MKTPASAQKPSPLPIDLTEIEAVLQRSYRRTWYAACALGSLFLTISAYAALN